MAAQDNRVCSTHRDHGSAVHLHHELHSSLLVPEQPRPQPTRHVVPIRVVPRWTRSKHMSDQLRHGAHVGGSSCHYLQRMARMESSPLCTISRCFLPHTMLLSHTLHQSMLSHTLHQSMLPVSVATSPRARSCSSKLNVPSTSWIADNAV